MPGAGTLRERLAFQENTPTKDSTGGYTPSWATLDSRWGSVTALTGREILQAQAIASLVAYRVVVRQGPLQAAAVSISSITRSGTTATVTTAAAHGLTTGEYVRVAGADQSDYNIRAQVTVSSTTIFTMEVANSPTTPATGTMTSTRLFHISASLRISWTPSWDSTIAAKTLEVLAVRPYATSPRMFLELDCGEEAA